MLFRPPLRRPALHNVFSIFHESRREDSSRISRIFQLSFINQQPSWCVIRSKICGRKPRHVIQLILPFERNKFIEITLLAPFSDILFISMLYANSSYIFLLFFSISRYLLHLLFTGNIRIIYIKITRSRWEKLLKVNCGRRERERGGKFGKFDLLGIASLPSLPSLSTANSFPLVQNFSAERKHCTEGHTGTRSDGSTTDGAQPSRSSPASARVSARTARRPLFTAGFPSSWKFRGALYFA